MSARLNANDETLNCPGHCSRFDCDNGDQGIWGRATRTFLRVLLPVNAKGDIFAEGIDELLYRRLWNVLRAPP